MVFILIVILLVFYSRYLKWLVKVWESKLVIKYGLDQIQQVFDFRKKFMFRLEKQIIYQNNSINLYVQFVK